MGRVGTAGGRAGEELSSRWVPLSKRRWELTVEVWHQEGTSSRGTGPTDRDMDAGLTERGRYGVAWKDADEGAPHEVRDRLGGEYRDKLDRTIGVAGLTPFMSAKQRARVKRSDREKRAAAVASCDQSARSLSRLSPATTSKSKTPCQRAT
jgi:hypothetical protein